MKLSYWGFIISLGFIAIAVMLVTAQAKYQKEQQQKKGQIACYIDHNAYNINTYMLYGKTYTDTVFECRTNNLLTSK